MYTCRFKVTSGIASASALLRVNWQGSPGRISSVVHLCHISTVRGTSNTFFLAIERTNAVLNSIYAAAFPSFP
ncbi:hypothetical protein EYF80_024694 [Liparis tanakae]|uniref:Uncharacterized protein n=1 Tax=Liparis tanakae TaxID=230148 RepID=A0A4Z2HII6_9TELE|nr:hypothetical protein EYF80_024694 [Liparis tanakae]